MLLWSLGYQRVFFWIAGCLTAFGMWEIYRELTPNFYQIELNLIFSIINPANLNWILWKWKPLVYFIKINNEGILNFSVFWSEKVYLIIPLNVGFEYFPLPDFFYFSAFSKVEINHTLKSDIYLHS